MEVPTLDKGKQCTTEPIVKGKVYSMKALSSMNITVEELNETEIKDAKLYDDLMSQYYHIIHKFTASGAYTEEVIYKQ